MAVTSARSFHAVLTLLIAISKRPIHCTNSLCTYETVGEIEIGKRGQYLLQRMDEGHL